MKLCVLGQAYRHFDARESYLALTKALYCISTVALMFGIWVLCIASLNEAAFLGSYFSNVRLGVEQVEIICSGNGGIEIVMGW
jgi:hypothetical protein